MIRRFNEGVRVARQLGSWVFYELRDADNREHFAGYLRYRVEDFTRQRKRASSAERRHHYSQLVGQWRKAVRWVESFDEKTRQGLVSRMIDQLPDDIPYVQPESGHASLGVNDRPPRRTGRPRKARARRSDRAALCEGCGGLGYVKA